MKKLSRKELIEILKNKSNSTYNELASLTGYHPKSLVRINSMIKKNEYSKKEKERFKMYESVITEYINSTCKTYKEFYNSNLLNYQISYPTLCNILRKTKLKKEMVLIRKRKKKGNYYFEVMDYQNESLLFTYDSMKNDIKSLKNIIYLLLKNYGSPKNISFANFFKNVPTPIQDLLNKYHMNRISFKSSFRKSFKNLSNTNTIKYQPRKIKKEDFYNRISRKTIADNVIQFNNIRYQINTKVLIKQNTTINLYYNNEKKDLFIKLNATIYTLTPYKDITSKKGNSKYI